MLHHRLAFLTSATLVLVASCLGAAPRFEITHLAGSTGGGGKVDGTGTAARFREPQGLAADALGNLYVADTANHTIRKISPGGGVMTLAGLPGTTGSADGAGSAARFKSPSHLAVDAVGNVYVSDTGNLTVRMINPLGAVTTLAGATGQSGSTDGTGAAARFAGILGLVVDRTGNAFVVDSDRTSGRRSLRKITSAGAVTTIAVVDQSGQPVTFREFTALAIDPAGNLMVADISAQLMAERFLLITPGGVASTLPISGINAAIGGAVYDAAGNLYLLYPHYLTGPFGVPDGQLRKISATGASSILARQMLDAYGLAVDAGANLYVALTLDHEIVKVAPDGSTATFAGLRAENGYVNATGSAARFSDPGSITLDPDGNGFVGNSSGALQKVSPQGVVTKFADPTTTGETITITGLARESSGSFLVADHYKGAVRRMTADGRAPRIAGEVGSGDGIPRDGPGILANFAAVHGGAIDSQGNFYTADHSAIRKVTPAAVVTTLAGSLTTSGSADGPAVTARFSQPFGVAVDRNDNVYVADTSNHTIRKISTTGSVTTIAGTAGQEGSADGVGAAARFSHPGGIMVDNSGNIYVADTGNGTIRFIAPDGTVSTVAGKANEFGSDDGIDREARFDSPAALALDATGKLWIVDRGNFAVRLGIPRSAPSIAQHPQSQGVAIGGNATFSVTAAADPAPSYQWKLNGGAITGATNASLAVSPAQAAHAGAYTVVVTNSFGSAESDVATLTVGAASAPSPTPGNGAGGGGAPSAWFLLALASLGLVRKLRRSISA